MTDDQARIDAGANRIRHALSRRHCGRRGDSALRSAQTLTGRTPNCFASTASESHLTITTVPEADDERLMLRFDRRGRFTRLDAETVFERGAAGSHDRAGGVPRRGERTRRGIRLPSSCRASSAPRERSSDSREGLVVGGLKRVEGRRGLWAITRTRPRG